MDNQNPKEKYLQKLLGERAKVQSTDASLNLKKNLDTILENLVAAFPEGCFCPPSSQTITQIKNALNDLLIWSTSAPISSSLKLKLQDASNAVKNQLDAS
ncbi:40-residue YVTN family beta-propeller, partial [Bacillus cereus]